jgi:xylulokinase
VGINPSVIRAGNANMFLSPVFRQSLSDLTGAVIELYNTDGSQGAARGAGIGSGVYTSSREAFGSLEKITRVMPDLSAKGEIKAAYEAWLSELKKTIN